MGDQRTKSNRWTREGRRELRNKRMVRFWPAGDRGTYKGPEKPYKNKAERKALKKEHVKEIKARGGRHVPHEIHRLKDAA